MIKLPLEENTVVTVEQAVMDRYNQGMNDNAFYMKYLGAYPPETEPRSEFLNALTQYEGMRYDRG